MAQSKKQRIKSTSLNFGQSLFCLKVFYTRLIQILECYFNTGLDVNNEILNSYYLLLKNEVNNILSRKGFEKLKRKQPRLFESLIGDMEGLDGLWHDIVHKQAYGFYADIENLYRRSGSPSFELPNQIQKALSFIDPVLKNHAVITKELSLKIDAKEKSKPVFTIEYDEMDGCIYISYSGQRHPLHKPQLGSPNESFFRYVFTKPNKLIGRTELEKIVKKRYAKIIEQLGFTRELKTAFFPICSDKKGVRFNNPLTQGRITAGHVDPVKLLKQLSKIRGTKG